MTKVTISGKGKARGKPDIAIIEVRVATEDKNELECRRLNNVASESVVAAFKRVVAENDIYAVPAQVSAQYKSGFIGTRVSGYRGQNYITAIVRRLEVAEQLVAEINKLDEKTIQVSSFQFDLEEKDELEKVARRAAFASAKRRAETYAEEIGSTVGGVDTIEEYLHYGSTARHPSGKFGAVRLRDTNDFWVPTREGERETLEMGDIEINIDVKVCFRVGIENEGGDS